MAKSINNRYYLQLGWGNNPEYPTRAAAVTAAKKVAKETGKQQTIAVFGELAPRRIVRAGKYVMSSGGKSSAYIAVKPPNSPGKRSNPSPKYFYIEGRDAARAGNLLSRSGFDSAYSTAIHQTGWLTPAALYKHYTDGGKDGMRSNPGTLKRRSNPLATVDIANSRSPMSAAIGGTIVGFVVDSKGRPTHVNVMLPKKLSA